MKHSEAGNPNMLRITCMALLLCLLAAGTVHADEKASKPNVIILFADDLGYGDLGSYGHPYIRTPNLDALAAAGQRWTDFYVAAPVCSPSRGALLTGKLPKRTGLWGQRIGVFFPNARAGMPPEERTLPEALKEVGYRTAIIGKWHLGDAAEYLPTRHGFDYWYGLPYSNDMDWADGVTLDRVIAMQGAGKTEELQRLSAARQAQYANPTADGWNVPVLRSQNTGAGFHDETVERPADQPNITQHQTEEAIAFIEANREAPFFLYVPYSMPHTPIFRSEAFAGRSLGGRYGDVVEEIDWSVGTIVERLQSLGIAENTLVFFTSDNGPWLTMRQHSGSAGLLRHGKNTTFEGGMRVPGIFWWPGKLKSGVVSDIGSTLDVYSTVLKLAGAEPTAGVDGVDLSGTLLNGEPSPRTTMPYYNRGELRAFRSGTFKLHFITEGAYGQPPEREEHETPLLFNLANDPSEKLDVASQYPEVVAEILREVDEHGAGMTEKPPLFDLLLEPNQ
jgi:arylsulfatase A-like enzyme